MAGPGPRHAQAQPILEQTGPGSDWVKAFHALAHPFSQLGWARLFYYFSMIFFKTFFWQINIQLRVKHIQAGLDFGLSTA